MGLGQEFPDDLLLFIREPSRVVALCRTGKEHLVNPMVLLFLSILIDPNQSYLDRISQYSQFDYPYFHMTLFLIHDTWYKMLGLRPHIRPCFDANPLPEQQLYNLSFSKSFLQNHRYGSHV